MYDEGFSKATLRLYNVFGNMKIVAESLGIGIATIWRWNKMGIQNNMSKRSSKPIKLTLFVLEFIREIIQKTNTLTINEIAFQLRKRFNLIFSRQAIALAVNKLGFSRKRVSKRGSVKNQNLHQERLRAFKHAFEFSNNKVSIDESGFDFRVVPIYGYSLKNTKCISKCLSNQRKRVSLILAIKENGQFHYKCSYEKVNSKTFENFITSLPWTNSSLILDNASIHKTLNVQNAIKASNNTSIFIAPYTPECNPIENVFSVIKCQFRKMLVQKPNMIYQQAIDSILQNLDTVTLFKAVFNNNF